jgi:hypothetical protein
MRSVWHRMSIWILVAGLVLSQAVGVLHGGAHALPGHGHTGPAIAVDHAAHAPDHLAALFDDHESGSDDCRLLDQLAHGDLLLTVPPAALPVVVPTFFLLRSEGEALARWASLFDARGPPALL